MDQVHVVRHKVLVEGRSQRAVAKELGLARVTVRKYLDQAVPSRKSPDRMSRVGQAREPTESRNRLPDLRLSKTRQSIPTSSSNLR